MAWNSQMGNNEYTTVEQRRKQNLSRLPVSQDPVGGSVGGSEGTAVTADPFDAYKSLLKQMRNERQAQADAAFEAGKDNLDRAREAAMRDSYVAHMQGLKNMPQVSAVSGNGGYTQSLLARQQMNYENNRNAIEQKYLDDLTQLQTNRDNGVISSNQDYLAELAAIAKTNAGKTGAVKTSAAATATPAAYTYKLGGRTFTDQELVTYLKGQGMTQAEIARYMQAKGLTL